MQHSGAEKGPRPSRRPAPQERARRSGDGAAAGKKQAPSSHRPAASSGSSGPKRAPPQGAEQATEHQQQQHYQRPSNEERLKAKKKQRQQDKEMGQNHVTAAPAKPLSQAAALSRKGGRKRVKDAGDDLIESFKERLAGGTFRMLNEQVYTTPSVVAGQLLRDRDTYNQYHEGYRRQVSMWPSNPVDVIISALKGDKRGRFVQHRSKHLAGSIPNGWVIADMGCGDAAIAKAMKETNTVHSFDFCAANELVTPCDMAAVPLANEAADIVIFSLSLMSTNYLDYVYEGHRILKPNKLMKIAEVRSRLPDPERFAALVESIGFKLDWWGIIDGYFCVFDFVRLEGEPNREPFNADFDPCSLLTPCLYKRR